MTQDLTNFHSEVYSKQCTVVLNKNSVMLPLVNTSYTGEISKDGGVVHIRSFEGGVAVNPYTGTKIVTELVPTTRELKIDQFTQFCFFVDTIDEAQSDLDLLAGFMEQAKISVDLAKDTRIFSHVANVDVANVISDTQITKDNVYKKIKSLATVLKKNNVTAAMKPWVVIPVEVEDLLNEAPEFIQASLLGSKTLTEGSIGRIAGLDVFVSTNMVADGGVYSILAGTKNCIAFAGQVAKVEKQESQTAFGTQVAGLYAYGSEMVQPKGAAVLEVHI